MAPKNLRILIDDAGQCRTQSAVLAAWAASVPASVELLRTSALPAPAGWHDVPPESARRLAARIEALAPVADTLTIFLPGHMIPGELDAFPADAAGAPLPAWTTAADLDLFAVDNGSPLAAHFAQHRAVNPDYHSCGSYPVAGFTSIPSWLTTGGLASAVLLTQRPWYFAQVPGRRAWLRWLRTAFAHKLLTLQDVEADVLAGAARPSLLEDARALEAGGEPLASPDTTLDSVFTCPELRPTDRQYAMLHSRALQERILHNARLETLRKLAEAGAKPGARSGAQPPPLWIRLWRQGRSMPRRTVKAAYRIYSATLRPLIRGASAGQPRVR